MKGIGCILLAMVGWVSVQAQTIEVPRQVDFAGVNLRLSPGVRQEIQKDAEALVGGGKYFQDKADRARKYMPIVEQILREEGVPQDFKYLVIQESAFIPDAVSTSNAVGFWQFKEPSAMEVGLSINRQVDERMNIVAATRGACRYLKKFNETFDNWLFSLQAYNNGLSGAQQVLPRSGYGARSVEVNTQSHWYVKKYLAHRIAYMQAVEPIARPTEIYSLYQTKGGETWGLLSRQLKVEERTLAELNVWLKVHRVPDDKSYFVVYPVDNPSRQDLQTLTRQEMDEEELGLPESSPKEEYPTILTDTRVSNQPFRITINGKRAIVAGRYDDINTLALKAELLPEKMREYNDMDRSMAVIPGQYYYLESKRNRARVYYHTVQQGESLWYISQKYGVKLDRLMQKNRMDAPTEVAPGMVLWLRFIRPADIPVQYEQTPVQEVSLVSHNQEMIDAALTFLESEGPVGESELPASPKEPLPLPIEGKREEAVDSVGAAALDAVDSTGIQTAPTVTPDSSPSATEVTDSAPMADTAATDSAQNTVVENPRRIALYPAPATPDSSATPVPDSVERIAEENVPAELDRDEVPQVTEPQVNRVTDTEEAEPAKEPNTGPNGPNVHVVQQGETLYGLARLYSVSIQSIAQANDLDMSIPIAIDQKLIIPAKNEHSTENNTSTPVTGGTLIHEVKAGETMYSLSRQYGVRVEDLRHWNDKPDYTLKVGEKLIIKR